MTTVEEGQDPKPVQVEGDQDIEALIQRITHALRQPEKEELDQVETMLDQLESYVGQVEEQLQDKEEEERATLRDRLKHHQGQLSALQAQYTEAVKARNAAIAAEQQANLDTKWRIIQDIRDLISTSERIQPALQRMRELQSEWRKTGNVPEHAFQQLRTSYAYEVDRFYYTISIYRDLRDLDLQKNLEIKKDLVQQMEALQQEPKIKRQEMMVKALQEEWEEAGPVPHDQWEPLRNAFYAATDAVYANIKAHYDSIRQHMADNLEKKQKLIHSAKQLSGLELSSPKKWNEKTQQILALQKEWKTIGRVPREHNERIWKDFRAACDRFFEGKRAFFKALKTKHAEGKAIKEQLLARAKPWATSEDWKAGTQALIQLQQQWKDAPPADRATEHALWEAFREVCDAFFERKKEHFAAQKEKQSENEQAKRALLAAMAAYQPGADKKETLKQIKQWMQQWKSIGHVPRKSMEALNSDFKKQMDALYKHLDLSKAQKGKIDFANKVELLAGRPDARKQLSRERQQLRQKLRKQEADLQQYRDNFNRFGVAGKTSPLVEEMRKKITQLEAQIARTQEQLAIIDQAEQGR